MAFLVEGGHGFPAAQRVDVGGVGGERRLFRGGGATERKRGGPSRAR